MIGLIVPSVAHPFFGELAYHLEECAGRRGYRLLLCNSNRDVAKERQYVDMLKKNQVDAIVMGSSVLEVEHYFHLNLPIVSFDRNIAEDIPIVASDNYAGGAMAARHLLEKGCRAPACVYRGIGGPHHEALLAEGRIGGFERTLIAEGLRPLRRELSSPEGAAGRSEGEIAAFLSEHPEVDGVFASSDLIAAEFIQACRRIGRRIPEELKLIGYDDTAAASFVAPRLTTVRQPIRDMCELTVELIVRQLAGEKVVGVHSFPVTLVERETT